MKDILKMLSRLKKYWVRVLAGIIILIIVDGIQVFIPRILKYAIDGLATGHFVKPLSYFAILIIILAFTIAFFRFWWRYFVIGTSRLVEREMRDGFFSHLISMDPLFFVKRKIGDLMAHATNDIDAIRMAIGMGLIALTDALFLSFASIFMMTRINLSLTLYALIPAPFLTVITYYFGVVIHRKFEYSQAGFSLLTEKVREFVSGIKIIKGYNQETGSVENFDETNKEYYNRMMSLMKYWTAFDPLLFFFASLSYVAVIWFGAWYVIYGKITLGDLVAFVNYLDLMIWPMIAFGWVVNLFQRGSASFNRVERIMKEQPTVIDIGKPTPIKGKIELRNLMFSYNGKRVLNGINAVFKNGKITAIVGPTGAGKSTIVELIMRFYPVNGIYIDDKPAEDVSLSEFRKRVGYVPQETFLFSDTIANNISLGKPSASKKEIVDAAKVAMIYDEIMELPNGFEAMLGEKGVNLSGGQKQRIAIARAIILNPQILILDDALSSVDSHTEKKIIENLSNFLKERNSIIISHRISAIKDADEILVIDDGRIVERGIHKELITKEGLYYLLYKRQQLEEKLDAT